MSTSLPPLGLLRRYLRVDGWLQEATQLREIDLFVKTDSEVGRLEIPLPRHARVVDADRRVAAGLQTLSDLKETSLEEVTDEVRGIGFDQIEARLPVSPVRKNSIPLRSAQNFLNATRTLLSDAAATEIEPGPDVSSADGNPFVEKCQFAHTFHGSFGFRILSPVGPHEEYDLTEADHAPPFERRVVQRIARGMITVSKAAEAGDYTIVARDSHRGFGALACEDLARVLERSGVDRIDFRFVFSPEWLSSVGQITPVELRASMAPLIREAARSMKQRPDAGRVQIRGRITDLHSRTIPADLLSPGGREITVLWESEVFGDVAVRARLSAPEYLEAISAHQAGREVIVEGSFDPNTSRFRITEVDRFAVV